MNPNSNTTKTGFSKSGFSCCAFWNVCNMGSDTCYYEESDPEVKTYCRCYQRKHSQNLTPKSDNKIEKPVQRDLFSSSDSIEDKKATGKDEVIQLSLF